MYGYEQNPSSGVVEVAHTIFRVVRTYTTYGQMSGALIIEINERIPINKGHTPCTYHVIQMSRRNSSNTCQLPQWLLSDVFITNKIDQPMLISQLNEEIILLYK